MSTEDAASIGQNLRAARETAGMSIRGLAERVGVDAGYVSRLEKGQKRNPSIELLQKFADALSIDVQQILSGPNVKSERAAPRAYLRRLGLSSDEIDHVAGLIENYQAKREEGHYEEDDKN